MTMSHEVDIHQAQTLILRELLFQPSAGFAELQKPTGLTSDNFNFHVKRLLEVGFIEKVSRGQYKLTQKGKEYANKLDTDENTIERQPKVAVLLVIQKGEKYLMQERLKHPYFGFWGCPTGKIRWGETIVEAAARELMEETGLTADLKFCGLYHERAYDQKTKKNLEDKLFHIIHCTNPKGKMQEEFEGGRNAWMTREEAESQDKIFKSFEIEIDMVHDDRILVEEQAIYDDVEF